MTTFYSVVTFRRCDDQLARINGWNVDAHSSGELPRRGDVVIFVPMLRESASKSMIVNRF
jgi:hypothetical protein